jgi:hypothetical protein
MNKLKSYFINLFKLKRNILFESDRQFRETKIIWRICTEIPLLSGFTEKHPWFWFAINIPMDLVSNFRGDIDMIACLSGTPKYGDFDNEKRWYKTWEVKTILLDKSGNTISLKSGKTKGFIKQLKIQRNFGSPNVSLLEVYLLQNGFTISNRFPPEKIKDTVLSRVDALSKKDFGYQWLPFEHDEKNGMDFGLKAYPQSIVQAQWNILGSKREPSKEKFDSLVNLLNEFYNEHKNEPGLAGFPILSFCRKCKKLIILGTMNEIICMHCGRDLTIN